MTAWESLQILKVYCFWGFCLWSPISRPVKNDDLQQLVISFHLISDKYETQYTGGCFGSSMSCWENAPCCKGYQTALLLQILITEKNPSDQLWEQEDKQRIMGVSYWTKQRALSLDRWTVVFLRGKTLSLSLTANAWQECLEKKWRNSLFLQSVTWFTPSWSRVVVNELDVTRIFLNGQVPSWYLLLWFTTSGDKTI